LVKKHLTKKEKKRKSAAKKAARLNRESEENFVKRLVRRGFTANVTGKAKGLPDILAYKKSKLQFFEIKPSRPSSMASALLKKDQGRWIKDYCLKKGVKATLVYYKGSRKFKYKEIKLNSKNIDEFVQGGNSDILERTKEFSYR
jgi:Holliday junction resolvase